MNETAALEKMPKGRLEYLKRLLPFLQNQSEDCLYLNVFAPVHGEFSGPNDIYRYTYTIQLWNGCLCRGVYIPKSFQVT